MSLADNLNCLKLGGADLFALELVADVLLSFFIFGNF